MGRPLLAYISTALIAVSLGVLGGCGGGGAQQAAAQNAQTSGPAFTLPSEPLSSSFDAAGAQTFGDGAVSIDTSHAQQGYVAAAATNPNRLKLQVVCGDQSYNYDLPSDGTPLVAPVNMGDGTYTVRVMQNTSGSNYVELAASTVDVALESEFAPYLRPNAFCAYTAQSACVAKARELAADAQNSGDALQAVCEWVIGNITYDTAKAEELRDVTGYVPDPDETLASGTGICFDYASLTAAMLRSLGIPTKLITGYVSPDNIYHAWNMVYIDGQWVTLEFSVDADTWSRVDLTFAASGSSDVIGDGNEYTDRYVY